MNYLEFINRVVSEGIEAAKSDYTSEQQKNKLDGSIAGFNACRNKQPLELIEVWKEAGEYCQKFFGDYDNVELYWWYRCYQMEVEWVCNVVSAMLYNQNVPPLLSWLPTCNGMAKAASILGVTNSSL